MTAASSKILSAEASASRKFTPYRNFHETPEGCSRLHAEAEPNRSAVDESYRLIDAFNALHSCCVCARQSQHARQSSPRTEAGKPSRNGKDKERNSNSRISGTYKNRPPHNHLVAELGVFWPLGGPPKVTLSVPIYRGTVNFVISRSAGFFA